MPSIRPIEFTGNFRNKPAHELQNILDDYFDRSYELCKLYNFASSTTLFPKLANQSRIAWCRLLESQRDTMLWIDYCEWIQKQFGSQLTLQRAIEAMENLSHTGPATMYTAKFNERHLCVKYLQGLEMHLRTLPELFRITDNFNCLKTEAETLDDMTATMTATFDTTTAQTNVSTTVLTALTPFDVQMGILHEQTIDRNDPMDLSHTELLAPPLTQDQKNYYCAKGWCTYCQERDHNNDHCKKLTAKRQQQQQN
ncbi:UNVERIFIED_CONTAM: hypothetical protein HDU68_005366 [Siphonaria sp. JEL0065]|nr:hypothetical protein HDU68_005366 [Siphonaria sp. JEL0065]